MDIKGKVAVITGAASGIGRAAAQELKNQGAAAIALVDMADTVRGVAEELNAGTGTDSVRAFQGDTTDEMFRKSVFDAMRRDYGGVNICIPAAGITRDALAVRLNKEKAATLMKEAMYYGVRCTVIHPGFTDTPMVRALGEDYINNHVIPATQIGRLIRPEEIADAICFLIRNSAVSGQLWADAGWHPMPT
jgi:NAD(P)-dependent dehydrogenase (short-subunit alcohol dehydrogenase family)